MKKYTQYVLRPGTGRTIPSATINVKAYPSTGGSGNATIYSDFAGTLPITQPFLSSAAGYIEFYAPDGRYDIYVVYADISYTLTDIWIFDANTPIVAISNLQNAHYITDRSESALNNELGIPTFQGHPDIVPVSPNAVDNEFNAVDGNWSNLNTDGNTQITFANSRLRIYQAGSTIINPVVGYERTSFSPGAGDWTLTALLRLGYFPGIDINGDVSGERPSIGLGIKDSLGNIISIGLRAGSQGLSVYNMNFSSSSLSSSEGYQQFSNTSCYVRVRHPSGGNYFFEWSANGIAWVTVKSLSSLGTIARMGIYEYASFATGGLVDGFADFVRFVPTIPY